MRDYKNRKIMLCQAYTQVSLKNKGLCACVLKCWDSIEGWHDGWQDTFYREPDGLLHQDIDKESFY